MLPHIVQSFSDGFSNRNHCKGNGKTEQSLPRIFSVKEAMKLGDL